MTTEYENKDIENTTDFDTMYQGNIDDLSEADQELYNTATMLALEAAPYGEDGISEALHMFACTDLSNTITQRAVFDAKARLNALPEKDQNTYNSVLNIAMEAIHYGEDAVSEAVNMFACTDPTSPVARRAIADAKANIDHLLKTE